MNILKKVMKFIFKIIYIIPVNKNKVYLNCFNGDNITGDQKYIYEYLMDKNKNFKFIWGISKNFNKDNYKNDRTKFVELKTIKNVYHIMTSKYIFVNINIPTYVPIRKNQVMVNSWHGYGMKKGGKYSIRFIQELFDQNTAFLSCSEKYTDIILKDMFNYKGDILNIGFPRNDIMFDNKKINSIRKEFDNNYNTKNKKLLLYAPTFRNDFEFYKSKLNFEQLKKNLSEKFGGEWIILLRVHPMLRSKYNINLEGSIDVSDYSDMQELLVVSDILITDYSGCMWDFLQLRRPMFAYCDDLAKYKENRGLAFEFDTMPFTMSESNEELEENIKRYDSTEYLEKLNKYFEKEQNYEKGNACDELYKYLKNK